MKADFFRELNKQKDKSVCRPIRKKREKNQITSFRNGREDITTDHILSQRITRQSNCDIFT